MMPLLAQEHVPLRAAALVREAHALWEGVRARGARGCQGDAVLNLCENKTQLALSLCAEHDNY